MEKIALWTSGNLVVSFTIFNCNDVAGFGLGIEMQFDTTSIELTQYVLDSPLDRRIISAVASDEFLDNGTERGWGQFRVWDTHLN